MTIAPLRHELSVKAPPERAFHIFAARMGEWWPKGMTTGKEPHVEIVVEPRAGGRWFERDASGAETDWGRVADYAPPHRLLLDWQLDAEFKYDPTFSTEVELTFEAAEGGTRVTLEHRNLERFGAAAEKVAGQLNGGWPTILGHYRDSMETSSTPQKETAQ